MKPKINEIQHEDWLKYYTYQTDSGGLDYKNPRARKYDQPISLDEAKYHKSRLIAKEPIEIYNNLKVNNVRDFDEILDEVMHKEQHNEEEIEKIETFIGLPGTIRYTWLKNSLILMLSIVSVLSLANLGVGKIPLVIIYVTYIFIFLLANYDCDKKFKKDK